MFGKTLLTLAGIGLIGGAPIADLSESHIYNPRWPPHAKFHNGQTISLSILLGLATLYYTHRRPASPMQRRQDVRVAVLAGSVYWVAGLLAGAFPGASGLDPEFGGPGFPQMPIFMAFLGMALVGGFVEGV
ncbi:hypothetical protein TD95_000776 [Thielaviopsis punctulata]|uniref:Uncharacterized protein n=1 Tax=Thielaviopsis punctulata TaxID=72032 RepID=A0A0F4ZAH0_9PEZI|nr:hypothetical protein TD95_000776 [Thielaviopsis punctulata]